MLKKITAFIVLTVFCGPMVISCAGADTVDFPSQDITIYVPYAAGGGTDVITRTVAPHLEEELGETVVVENQPGGAGAPATNEMLTSTPDGHTIMMNAASPAIVTPLVEDVGYTPDDFTAIGRAIDAPNILVVAPDSPYQTAEEFFAAAEDQESVSVGVSGATTTQTATIDIINTELGTDIQSVPFDGAAGSMAALRGGDVDATLGTTLDVAPTINAGDAEAIAATSPEFPETLGTDVPSMEDQGVEPPAGSDWYGLVGPEELPAEVVQEWENALESALEVPEVEEDLEELGAGPSFLDSEEFRQDIDEVTEVYEGVIEPEAG